MIKVERTNSKNFDFIQLVKELDSYLKITDGNEHDFYNQFNGIEGLAYTIVLYKDEKAIGCGAIKPFNSNTVEVKRMYVTPENRGDGIGSMILQELERWATELKYASCILETGKRQKEAIALYKKNNYQIIANYGQYKDMENSVCFRKPI
jgi:GNAT superfamily N-acetyltransferase